MSIGLCCQYIEVIKKRTGTIVYKNIVGEKRLQYGMFLKQKYSNDNIVCTWLHNVNSLFNILNKIHSEGFSSFRVSSSLFPLFDSVPDLLYNCTPVINKMKLIGDFILKNNIRLTTHPDQFVVLSSNNEDVILKSINILNHHGWVFDIFGLPRTPYYAINIHGGTKDNIDVLLDSISKLPDSVKHRLTLENDERSYSVMDLMPAFNEHNIPICFDSHHHIFNDSSLSVSDALLEAIVTWGDIKPLTHLSNTEPGLENGSFTERRKHSDYVHYIPNDQLLLNNDGIIDIDFEFKMKNIAIKKALTDFDLTL